MRLLFWQACGIAAVAGAGMSRLRIGNLSCSLYLFLFPFMGVLCGLGGALAYLGEPEKSVAASIGAIAQGYDGPRYVRVTGLAHPELALDIRPRSPASDEQDRRVLVALADPSGRGAIMVETAGGAMPPGGRDPVTFEGMVDPSGPEIYLNLPDKVAGMPLNKQVYLEEGASPGDPRTYALAGLAALLVLAPVGAAMASRYVVFGGRGSLMPPCAGPNEAPSFGGPVLASGEFALAGKARKRFLLTPAIVTAAADGLIAIVVNRDAPTVGPPESISASPQLRVGLWCYEIARMCVTGVQIGDQFYGTQQIPALLIRGRDGHARRSCIVLATQDTATRDRLADYIRIGPM